MIAMPTTIKVGAYLYRVITDKDEIRRMSDEADIDDSSEWSAFSDHDKLIIGINPEHHDDANRMTIVHELLHCTLRVSGVWPDSYGRIVAKARGQHGGYSVEEATVSGIANPLLGILRDNPELVAWLVDA